VYVTTAPKSNAVYLAFNEVSAMAKKGSFSPPKHILNAPTKLMKEEGYGTGYLYDHNQPDAFSGQNYFPEEIQRQEFYRPFSRGFEREIQKRLKWWKGLREARNKGGVVQ
jgi:putative ATPase